MNKALHDGLRNHCWIEGRSLIFEYRYAQAPDRLPALAAELVALNADLLIASSPQTAAALKLATASVPIVFVAVADPVGTGLVRSLSRPGGNITGVTSQHDEVYVKAIEALKELRPTIDRVGVLYTPSNIGSSLVLEQSVRSSVRLGIEVFPIPIENVADIATAFTIIDQEKLDTLSPVFSGPRPLLPSCMGGSPDTIRF
jgi:putative ABC transport system substrate-binding protein